jgi:hypothetical protein
MENSFKQRAKSPDRRSARPSEFKVASAGVPDSLLRADTTPRAVIVGES